MLVKYTDQYSFCLKEIRRVVFNIYKLVFSFLYYVVFANIMMKLIRKTGKM